ncbi:MAG TPA: hypothetical protein VF483_12755, partial [Gemmatimonadaceae bacterium]
MDVIVELAEVQGERGAPRWERAVSFQVPRGTLHLIKTRSAWSAPLLRLCLGFSEPATGAITVQGREPWALGRSDARALRGTIGSALEPDGLVANMSLRMNLITPLVFANGLSTDEAM